MGCGCKNKSAQQTTTQVSSQQIQESQSVQTQNTNVKEVIKKTVEKYYRK